jgi:hypothetical protein
LQLQHRDLIAEAVGRLVEVEVDGQKLSIKPELADVLPESFGCSSFAATAFPDCPTVAVFDLGSGTANVSTYKVSGGLPRRKYFEFMPIGINTLVDKIASELKQQSSNGRVNRDLIRFALTTNRYTLGYSGRSIATEVDKAIANWLALPEFTNYLNQLTAYLDAGIPVTACGGGWLIAKVRSAIETALQAQEGRLLITTEVGTLGVAGVVKQVLEENRIREEATEARRQAQLKAAEKKNKSKEGTNEGENK